MPMPTMMEVMNLDGEYIEDWGHVGDDFYAIVAIKPAYMWYGK